MVLSILLLVPAMCGEVGALTSDRKMEE